MNGKSWAITRHGMALPTLLVLLAVTCGLAAIEWALSAPAMPGPLTGVALSALVGACGWTVRKAPSRLLAAWAAGLEAVGQLAIGVAMVVALAVGLALWLPGALVMRLTRDDVATDAIVFALLGVALLVAGRAGVQYTSQRLRAAQAELRTQAAVAQEEQARAEIAERDRELARSELMLLRAQVEPHFLWNTLANVQYLVLKQPQDAHDMVGHLIAYLRASLPQMRSGSTTLASEIESVRAYLALMAYRMGPRLEVHIAVDPPCSHRPFPPLLLQTLVENAIKHGLEPKIGDARLALRATTREGAGLLLEVVDNGVGLQPNPHTRGTGLGLRSVRERLHALYGTGASLSIASNPDGGVTARIEIPE